MMMVLQYLYIYIFYINDCQEQEDSPFCKLFYELKMSNHDSGPKAVRLFGNLRNQLKFKKKIIGKTLNLKKCESICFEIG